MKITVVVEQAAENWGAFTPDDIGSVVATGPTREQAISNFRDALRFHLDGMREGGRTVPDVTELEIRETVAA